MFGLIGRDFIIGNASLEDAVVGQAVYVDLSHIFGGVAFACDQNGR
jgi:hypothetical protein